MDCDEIPPYFICPISLQLMKDPVTISTGISYDRESIQRWLCTYNSDTCPVTKQTLADRSLTPNHTLLRLIHSWAAATPSTSSTTTMTISSDVKQAIRINVSKVLRELVEAVNEPELQKRLLKKIRAFVEDDVENKAIFEKAGACKVIASLITTPESPPAPEFHFGYSTDAIGEAVQVLHLLDPSSETLRAISECNNGELIVSLSSILQRGTYRARIHAALLLRSIFQVVGDAYKTVLPVDLFEGIVEILKDHNASRATTLALLSILMEVIPLGRNRVKVVEVGAVGLLVELLVEEKEDKRRCEAMLFVLELLCARAEGRSALLAHPAGVAAVAGKILSVSRGTTVMAVKVLYFVCKYCGGGGGVVEEMMEVGGVAKLCMVVQVEGCRRTREKAKEILGMHLKAWSKFPCFHLNCLPLI